ncbi:MAG: DinB family protein [Acidobacteriaceae bacterium]|nr:DinB family protein [Acidobacteriaceae bacterium]MBV8571077.1 DinB family protein [Acidobacteriaceae bacterium]
MNQDKLLREHLIELLKGGHAHADFESVIKNLPVEARGQQLQSAPHSAWDELEHMRIAQWDILEFSRNPKHVSPEFPSGYWPASHIPPDEEAWDKSVAGFLRDRDLFIKLIQDPATDLYARIPHGDGQTVLREAMLAADHNAYHLGQLVLLRRLIGVWQ